MPGLQCLSFLLLHAVCGSKCSQLCGKPGQFPPKTTQVHQPTARLGHMQPEQGTLQSCHATAQLCHQHDTTIQTVTLRACMHQHADAGRKTKPHSLSYLQSTPHTLNAHVKPCNTHVQICACQCNSSPAMTRRCTKLSVPLALHAVQHAERNIHSLSLLQQSTAGCIPTFHRQCSKPLRSKVRFVGGRVRNMSAIVTTP